MVFVISRIHPILFFTTEIYFDYYYVQVISLNRSVILNQLVYCLGETITAFNRDDTDAFVEQH